MPYFVSKIFDCFNFSRELGFVSSYFTFFPKYCRGLERIDDESYLYINKVFRKWIQNYKLMIFLDDLYNKHLTLISINEKKLNLK